VLVYQQLAPEFLPLEKPLIATISNTQGGRWQLGFVVSVVIREIEISPGSEQEISKTACLTRQTPVSTETSVHFCFYINRLKAFCRKR